MRISEKCRNNKHSNNNSDIPLTSRHIDVGNKHNNNNFDNPLTSRRTDGGKN